MKTGGFQFLGNIQSPSVLKLIILSEDLTKVTAGKTITFLFSFPHTWPVSKHWPSADISSCLGSCALTRGCFFHRPLLLRCRLSQRGKRQKQKAVLFSLLSPPQIPIPCFPWAFEQIRSSVGSMFRYEAFILQ